MPLADVEDFIRDHRSHGTRPLPRKTRRVAITARTPLVAAAPSLRYAETTGHVRDCDVADCSIHG
jgi:hypothetical protein